MSGVVTVCLLALFLFVVPGILERFQASVEPKWRFDIPRIRAALAQFAAEHHGRFPETLTERLADGEDGSPYLPLNHAPRDAWKHEYRYQPPSSPDERPRVWSIGPDGIDGTTDDLGRGDEGHEVELRPSR